MDATQTGADTEQLAPAYAGRSAAMAEIAKNVDASYADDLSTFNEETGEIAQRQPAQTSQPVQDEPAQETQQAAPEPDDLETLMVDGLEVKVKRDQVLEAGKRALQKDRAADRRLTEATEALARARAYERSLSGQPSSDAGNLNQSPSSDATNSGAAQPTQDYRAIVREELWLDSANKAAMRFKEEFKDIADDPFAARLVAQLENERLEQAASEGKPLGDPWEAYKSHGEKVRAWRGAATSGQPVVSQDRQERKRDTVTVTGASARLQPPAPKKPLTASEIIEQQRLARQGRQIPTAR